MATKSTTTGTFEARVTIDIVEKNSYGDILSEGQQLKYSKKVSVTSLAGLGFMLGEVDRALDAKFINSTA